jgi:hypothetical protein
MGREAEYSHRMQNSLKELHDEATNFLKYPFY